MTRAGNSATDGPRTPAASPDRAGTPAASAPLADDEPPQKLPDKEVYIVVLEQPIRRAGSPMSTPSGKPYAVFALFAAGAMPMDDSLHGLWQAGYMPRSVCLYRHGGKTRFVATLWPYSPAREPPYDRWLPWNWKVSRSLDALQSTVDLMTGDPNPLYLFLAAHLRYLGEDGKDHDDFVTVWIDDNPFLQDRNFHFGFGGAYLDLWPTQIDSYVNLLTPGGQYPISVIASGGGKLIRYAAIFAPTDARTPRFEHIQHLPKPKLKVSAVDDPAIDPIDEYMLAVMRANGTRCAQIAGVVKNKLKFARAYTIAEASYPHATNTNISCIGSISKVLTKLATLQLLETRFGGDILHHLDDWKIADRLALSGYGRPQASDDYNNVTIKELITHTAGIRTDWMSGDDYFTAKTWIGEHGGDPTLPLEVPELMRWVYSGDATVPAIVDWTRGQFVYNGFSVVLLARLLEVELHRSAGDYDLVMQEKIFKPLGITRARMAPQDREASDDPAFIYHGPQPDAARRNRDPVPVADAKLGRTEYGSGWQIAGPAGGWEMAAIDVARIAAYLCSIAYGNGASLPVANPPLFTAAATAQLAWTELYPFEPVVKDPNTGESGPTTVTLAGTFLPDKAKHPGTVTHSGEVTGARADLAMRQDGSSVVVTMNGEPASRAVNTNHLFALIDGLEQDWPDTDLFTDKSLFP